jgi:hypothetical protein
MSEAQVTLSRKRHQIACRGLVACGRTLYGETNEVRVDADSIPGSTSGRALVAGLLAR